MKSLSLILEKQNSEIVSIHDNYSKMSINLASREKKTNAATQYQLLVAKQKLVITSTKRKKENLNVNPMTQTTSLRKTKRDKKTALTLKKNLSIVLLAISQPKQEINSSVQASNLI